MNGLMMDFPLTVPAILRRAETLFPGREIVTRRADRSLHRYRYADLSRRSRQLALGLLRLGIQPGDRVATLAWNHHQHLEAYFGVPGAGAVLHTLNLRLHPDDLCYIINHAGDRLVLLDPSLLPLWERLRGRVSARVVLLSGQAPPPASPPPPAGALDYEELLAAEDPAAYAEPRLDENGPAAMCYTTGTTGKPKGVLYSHRALVLHSLALGLVDSFGLGESDVVLPVVPMFHANAWGLPLAATLFGARQVLPGPHLDPGSLLELLQGERVTLTAGVPTIWLGLLQVLDGAPRAHDLSRLRALIVGGSAAPPAMIRGFQERHGLRVLHAWGMTETAPLGSVAHPPAECEGLGAEEIFAQRTRQGRPVPLVEIRARGEGGPVPWDGRSMGELEVRGPWVARAYYNIAEGESTEGAAQFTDDGWFRTGDIVTIDQRGSIQIQDRSKDLIKSGGEWISSVALENALMGHPAVAEAAVVAVPHPRWQERPLAVVVLRPGQSASADELRQHLGRDFAPFWVPDAVEFVSEIPKTSAGKFRKSALREQFEDRQVGPA